MHLRKEDENQVFVEKVVDADVLWCRSASANGCGGVSVSKMIWQTWGTVIKVTMHLWLVCRKGKVRNLVGSSLMQRYYSQDHKIAALVKWRMHLIRYCWPSCWRKNTIEAWQIILLKCQDMEVEATKYFCMVIWHTVPTAYYRRIWYETDSIISGTKNNPCLNQFKPGYDAGEASEVDAIANQHWCKSLKETRRKYWKNRDHWKNCRRFEFYDRWCILRNYRCTGTKNQSFSEWLSDAMESAVFCKRMEEVPYWTWTP